MALKSILSLAFWGTFGVTTYSIDGERTALAQEKPTVVASHSIICHFVKAIAENTVNLTCLDDGTQDPHTYRPTIGDRQLEEAQLILYGGYELEPKFLELIKATETSVPKIAVYEVAAIEPIPLADSNEVADTDEAEENRNENISDEESTPTITDNLEPAYTNQPIQSDRQSETEKLEANPHIWHDVENAVAIVRSLQTALTQLNPSNAALYLQNSVAMEDRLLQLNLWIEEQIATIPQGQKILVTVHDAFSYYVRAYEFADYLSLQSLNKAESPTALQLREFAMQIRQQEIPIIFAEATASDRVISSVAREAGVNLSKSRLFADSLGTTDSYIEMMVDNTCTIVNGLKGNCTTFEN